MDSPARGVEVYRGGIVLYSLGNLIFGHCNDKWMDNILARITFTHEGIARVEVLPIAGIERELGQPYLLEGERANNLLTDLQARSATLDTVMEIEDGVGVIKPVATAVPTMVYNITDGISARGENPTAQTISGGAAPNGAAPFTVRGTCTEAGRRTRRNWPRAISRLVAPRSAFALTPLPPCGVP